MTRALIIGLDIGTTTGISIIDLNKKTLFVKSKKNFSLSQIKNQIMEFGKPVIIATDKKKIPAKISKIASTFGSNVFSPRHDLSVEEKKKILKRPMKNPHERDSLSAAFFAYKFYEKKFKQIEKVLESKGLKDYEYVVKEMLIQKEVRNLSEAIELLKPRRKLPVIQLTKEINIDWKGEAERREREYKEERKRNEILKIYCEKLDEKIKALERQKQSYLEEQMQKNETVRKAIIKEKEIQSRDILIKQLKFEIAKRKDLLKVYEEKIKIEQEEKNIITENLVPVVIIPEFSNEQILNADKKFNIMNKVIFFENPKYSKRASKTLEKITPKVVIADLDSEIVKDLKKYGIIVVDKIEMKKREFFGQVPPERIKDLIKKVEKKNFVNWLEEYRRR